MFDWFKHGPKTERTFSEEEIFHAVAAFSEGVPHRQIERMFDITGRLFNGEKQSLWRAMGRFCSRWIPADFRRPSGAACYNNPDLLRAVVRNYRQSHSASEWAVE